MQSLNIRTALGSAWDLAPQFRDTPSSTEGFQSCTLAGRREHGGGTRTVKHRSLEVTCHVHTYFELELVT